MSTSMSTTKRFLLYAVLNYTEKEMPLFHLMMRSLRRYSSYDKYDFIIITNKAFSTYIKRYLHVAQTLNVKFMIIPRDKDLRVAKTRRMEILRHPDLHKYETVMYMDGDCIVQGDFVPLMDRKLKKGVLYPYTEDGSNLSHKSIFYGLQNYTNEQMEWLRTHYIKTFSTGVFMFKPCNEFSKHIKAIQKMMLTHKGPYFTDQSFFNYYFNINKLSDTSVLTGRVISRNIKNNIEGKPTLTNTMFDTSILINHFCGLEYWDEKRIRMVRFWNMVKKLHECNDRS